MIRTNSKQAKENIYKYIRDYCEDYLTDDYAIDAETISTKTGLYKAIYNIYQIEIGRASCRERV